MSSGSSYSAKLEARSLALKCQFGLFVKHSLRLGHCPHSKLVSPKYNFLSTTISLSEAFVTLCLYYYSNWLQNSGFCTSFYSKKHDKMSLIKQNNKILRFYYFIPLLKTSSDSLFLILSLCALPSSKFSITLPLLASINPVIN